MRQKSSSRYQSRLKAILLGGVLFGLSGCATLGWYGQAARGQLDILSKREDIAQLLADPATDPALARRLESALEIRAFAVAELGLPDSRSYTRYADLGRDAAVWNVVATPRFDMRPKTWCYPLVGCLAYRGFFDPDRAHALARDLAAEGYDAAVFPVTAYSTLGWFADPVLNTMLRRDDAGLAALIFHELAHEKLFLRGDTQFSEGYAVAVERVGMERWLQASGDEAALARWRAEQDRQARFTGLLLDARAALIEVYAAGRSVESMEAEREQVFAELRAAVRALDEDTAEQRYRRWAERDLNNAHLALVATYEAAVAGFLRLLEDCSGDIGCFHDRAAELARLDLNTRQRILGDTE